MTEIDNIVSLNRVLTGCRSRPHRNQPERSIQIYVSQQTNPTIVRDRGRNSECDCTGRLCRQRSRRGRIGGRPGRRIRERVGDETGDDETYALTVTVENDQGPVEGATVTLEQAGMTGGGEGTTGNESDNETSTDGIGNESDGGIGNESDNETTTDGGATDIGQSFPMEDETDENGEVEFEELEDGEYTVTAENEGWGDRRRRRNRRRRRGSYVDARRGRHDRQRIRVGQRDRHWRQRDERDRQLTGFRWSLSGALSPPVATRRVDQCHERMLPKSPLRR